jgi:hypothetical protein
MQRGRFLETALELGRDAEHEQRLRRMSPSAEERQRVIADRLHLRVIRGLRSAPHQAKKRLAEAARVPKLAKGGHAHLERGPRACGVPREPRDAGNAVERNRGPDVVLKGKSQRTRITVVARCLRQRIQWGVLGGQFQRGHPVVAFPARAAPPGS